MAKKEKAPKTPKAAKAKKKPQFNTEQGGIGKLFQQHGEKMAFGVVFVAAAALVYLGWSASTTLAPDESQTPEKIRSLAQSAKQNIEKTPPDVVVPPAPLTGMVENVVYDPWPNVGGKFPTPKPLPRTIKTRKDPTLFAPIKPEVTAVTGAIAWNKDNPDQPDPMAQLKAWAEKTSTPSGGGGVGGPGGEGGGPGAPGGGGGGKSGGAGGGPPGGIGGMGGIGGLGGMGGAMGSNGLVGLLDDGYQAFGGDKVAPKTIHAMFAKFLVPNELQVLEYKDKFDGTDEVSQVNALGFQIQRTEVKSPTDTAFNWVTIASNLDCEASALIKKYGWESVGQIVADPSVVHPNLTMPSPPFLSRNYYDFSLHSETPKGMSILVEPEKPKDEENKNEGGRKPGEFKLDPGAGGGGLAGMPGGMMGGGPPGMGGNNPYGGGRGGALPGMGGGRGRPAGGDGGDEGLGAGGGGGMRMGAPGGMGMGPPGGIGGMGGGGMFGGGSGGSGLSKYYLLRYCDVEVEAGKYYRYRVRVIYEDPNKPIYESFGTRPAAMDESVLERQHQEQLAREKAGEKESWKQHVRFTDWSEPTPAAKVVDGNYAFAGPSSSSYGPSAQRIPGNKAKFFGAEPSAQFVPVVYDSYLGCDIYPNTPLDNIQRGTVLDFDPNGAQQKRKAIHPISREAKEVTEYPSNTGITVVDILGGETTAFRSGDIDALFAPLDVMLVDQSGRVVVRSDMADETDYYKFVERKEPRRKQEAGGGLGGAGGPPGGIGGIGGPGGGEGGGSSPPGGGGKKR